MLAWVGLKGKESSKRNKNFSGFPKFDERFDLNWALVGFGLGDEIVVSTRNLSYTQASEYMQLQNMQCAVQNLILDQIFKL